MPIMLIAKTFSTLNIFCGVGRGSLSNSRIPPPFHFQQSISILLLRKQSLKTRSLLQRIIKVATGSSPTVFFNPSADTYKGHAAMAMGFAGSGSGQRIQGHMVSC
ncbi:hypothetical protein MA16_Dca024533 [Dendrobium catenatum]|uniref:Uncharacterized protein n=1 Tax=Dendrobium catenatum TaxID=906689 RepID=A0A2I0W227_9ASPA|nr:hypothetical protein MA16_Dca024533 [Dendrobium catenatum]